MNICIVFYFHLNIKQN